MSMNLISTNRAVDTDAVAKANWAAITAVSAADAESPYPTEGYVRVTPAAVAAAAALLAGAPLANGQTVTTYDFSRGEDEEGGAYTEAHVKSFGPSLLDAERMAALRAILAPFPHAAAMLDVVVERGLQVTLSTETPAGLACAHLQGVNWVADEVEIRLSGGWMKQMLSDLGLPYDTLSDDQGFGEVDFETFAKAVNDNHAATDYPSEVLREFVACGRRQSATHVHWA